ncbi:hypothetical protein GCM10010441_08470 [Kitasatospora paracochleata]|uniref:Ribosomal protein S27E n=1 Tax=Kitasatospora paracochleata TaxID=58354 RepID=A0ABT1IXV6_9ACTN|nr:hypothetical protein [Kitasatospora paracochleata]MCP2309748.1 ribosomal protein S27E [Kitasatospora paracochleata]
MSQDQDFHFSVVHNGMDYLVNVMECLTPPVATRDTKYAVLHTQAATEVLLKWPLIQHDWRLVVVPDEKTGVICDEDSFRRGDFRSIGLGQAIKLLDEELDIKVPGRAKRAISRLSNSRNRLQHLGMSGSTDAVQTSAAKVLDFLLDFIRDHLRDYLDPDDTAHVDREMASVRERLKGVQTLIETRMARIRSDLGSAAGWAVECPECGQDAMMINEDAGTASCLYCHAAWSTPGDAAGEYAWGVLGLSAYEQVKDGGMPPVRNCPECETDSLVPGAFLARAKDLPVGLCFSCGEVFSKLAECEGGCGNLTTDTEFDMCPYCFEVRLDRF